MRRVISEVISMIGAHFWRDQPMIRIEELIVSENMEVRTLRTRSRLLYLRNGEMLEIVMVIQKMVLEASSVHH